MESPITWNFTVSYPSSPPVFLGSFAVDQSPGTFQTVAIRTYQNHHQTLNFYNFYSPLRLRGRVSPNSSPLFDCTFLSFTSPVFVPFVPFVPCLGLKFDMPQPRMIHDPRLCLKDFVCFFPFIFPEAVRLLSLLGSCVWHRVFSMSRAYAGPVRFFFNRFLFENHFHANVPMCINIVNTFSWALHRSAQMMLWVDSSCLCAEPRHPRHAADVMLFETLGHLVKQISRTWCEQTKSCNTYEKNAGPDLREMEIWSRFWMPQ